MKRYFVIALGMAVFGGIFCPQEALAVSKFELYMKIKEAQCVKACAASGQGSAQLEQCYRDKRGDTQDPRKLFEVSSGLIEFDKVYARYQNIYSDPRELEQALMMKYGVIPFPKVPERSRHARLIEEPVKPVKVVKAVKLVKSVQPVQEIPSSRGSGLPFAPTGFQPQPRGSFFLPIRPLFTFCGSGTLPILFR